MGQRQVGNSFKPEAKLSSRVAGDWGISLRSSWFSHIPECSLSWDLAQAPFPLLLVDETNPGSQALSLEKKTTFYPSATSLQRALGSAPLRL